MEEMRWKVHSKKIKEALEESSGFVFEEHASFLIKKWKDSEFRLTPLRHDGKIDGCTYVETVKNGIEIYSMYGKERLTDISSLTVYKKLRGDLRDAIKHAKNHGFQLMKWHPVTNFKIDTIHKHRLSNACKKHGITFEELDPISLVSKLSFDQICEVACFYHAVDAPEMTFASGFYFNFPDWMLLRIADYQSKSTDEQFDLMYDIKTAILRYAELDDGENASDILLREQIKENTRLPRPYVFSYRFVGNTFLPDANHGALFYKNDKGLFVIQIPNLYPLFALCQELFRQLSTGGYDIPQALWYCYMMANEDLTVQMEFDYKKEVLSDVSH